MLPELPGVTSFVLQNSPRYGHHHVAHMTGKTSSRELKNLSRLPSRVTSLDLGIDSESGLRIHIPDHSPGFPSLLLRPWGCWSQQGRSGFRWFCRRYTASSPTSTLHAALESPPSRPGLDTSAAWFRNIAQIPTSAAEEFAHSSAPACKSYSLS